jgi:hypothetical protein
MRPRVAEQAEFHRQVRRYCQLFATVPGLTDVAASAKVFDSNGSHFFVSIFLSSAIPEHLGSEPVQVWGN